jgi:phosphoribosylanthranilate isomerase
VKRAAENQGFTPPRFVGLFVDGGEKALAETAPFLSHFQFHGHESPERCSAMAHEFGVEVIKAIPIAEPSDIAAANNFAGAAEMLIFDSRPPKGADRPGGHGAEFDWSIAARYDGETPFLLAGGLDAANVSKAVKAAKKSRAFAGVDVSSGVEKRPGEKDPERVAAFIDAAKKAL